MARRPLTLAGKSGPGESFLFQKTLAHQCMVIGPSAEALRTSAEKSFMIRGAKRPRTPEAPARTRSSSWRVKGREVLRFDAEPNNRIHCVISNPLLEFTASVGQRRPRDADAETDAEKTEVCRCFLRDLYGRGACPSSGVASRA